MVDEKKYILNVKIDNGDTFEVKIQDEKAIWKCSNIETLKKLYNEERKPKVNSIQISKVMWVTNPIVCVIQYFPNMSKDEILKLYMEQRKVKK